MKIGIYVGSFNPVHKGHIAIAKACIEQGFVDEVWMIATGSYWEKKNLYPLKDRIAMLKLVVQDHMAVNEVYNELPYTYMIFSQLLQDYPEHSFSLILGADNLPRFHEWKNYEELLPFDFIVLQRDAIKRKRIVSLMKELGKENYKILKLKPIAISSTYIRDHLFEYEKISDMIDKDVYQYLKHMENETCNMKSQTDTRS